MSSYFLKNNHEQQIVIVCHTLKHLEEFVAARIFSNHNYLNTQENDHDFETYGERWIIQQIKTNTCTELQMSHGSKDKKKRKW